MATDHNFIVKNGLEVGGVLIVNSSGQLVVADVTSNLDFADNVKAQFGTGNDLQIYHDGSNSNIVDTGTGYLSLRGTDLRLQDSSGWNFVICTDLGQGGEVALLHSNIQKLKTTTSGIDVTGTVEGDGLIINGGASSPTHLINGSRAGTLVSIDNESASTSTGLLLNTASTNANSNILQVTSNDLNRFKVSGNGDISFYEDTGTDTNLIWDASESTLQHKDSVQATFGDSSDLKLYHNGTTNNSNIENYTGGLYITQYADDQDIIFRSDDGSGGISEYMRVDGGITKTVFSRDTKYLDGKQALFGTNDDLRVKHDGTNGSIDNFTGDLLFRNNADDKDIVLQSDNGSGGLQDFIRIDGSGDRTIFSRSTRHNDNAVATFGTSEDLQIYHDGTNSSIQNATGDLYIDNNSNDKDIIFRSDDESGGLSTYFQLDGSQGQLKVHKNMVFFDDIKAYFGGGADLGIWHNGTHSHITNNQGSLYIRSSNTVQIENHSGNDMITAASGGAVTLFHNAGSKLATKSDGVDITGELQSDSLDVDGNADISGNLVLGGNLTVNGTTTSVSSTNTTITDALIELGSGNTGTNANDLGLILERGTSGNNAFIGFDESDDQIAFALTTATGSSTGNLAFTSFLPIRTGTITAGSGSGIALDLNGSATVSGSITFDGTAVYNALNMANNNIVNVNNISISDPGPNEGVQWSNIKIYESPNDLTTNSSGNFQVVYGSTRRFTVNSTGADVNGTLTASGDIVASGDVKADTHFTSSDSNATLSSSGSGGNVHLRPNGKSTSTGQTYINSDGVMVVNTISTSHGLEVAQSTNTGYAPASILLKATQSTARGGGIYSYNTQSDNGWYSGSLYNNTNLWAVTFLNGTSFNPAIAQTTNAIFTIDGPNGRVGIGTTAPISHLHVNKDTSGHNTDGITLGKVEATGWIDTNEEMGRLGWAASYGSSFTPAIGAYISAKADANWDGNEAPTRLGFFTAPENSLTPVERMRIDSSGRVGINNTSPSSQYFNNLVVGDNSAGDKGITIRANSANKGVLAFSDTDSADANRYTGYISYQHTDNSMRFHTNGGGLRLSIDSAGTITQSGGDYDYSAGTNFDIRHLGAGQNITFHTKNSSNVLAEKMRIRGDGNVGIATANPSEKLQVDGNIALNGELKLVTAIRHANSGAQVIDNDNDTYFILNDPEGANRIKLGDSGDASNTYRNTIHKFEPASGTEYMRINATGVGIGTNNPGHKLHVVGTNNTTPFSIDIGADASYNFKANSSSTYVTTFNMDADGLTIGHDSGYRELALQTDDTNRLVISPTGNTTLSGNLEVQGADVTITANIKHAGDTDTYFGFHGNNLWRVVTGGTERIEVRDSEIVINDGGSSYDFRVESNNKQNMLLVDGSTDRVGIGTSSPLHPLHVAGNIYSNGGDLRLDSSQKLIWGNSEQWIQVSDNDQMKFIVNNGEKVYFQTDGRIETRMKKHFRVNDVGNLTAPRYYKIATVNKGNSGITIKGTLANHVESFGTCKFDLAIFGREDNNGANISVNGTLDVASPNSGVRIVKQSGTGTYINYDVYIVVPTYAHVDVEATIHGSSNGTGNFIDWHGNNTYVTTAPTGAAIELNTSSLTAGHYKVTDSAISDAILDIPTAPSITSTSVVNETIELVFAQSATTGVDHYEVHSDGATGSDYSLIARIPPEDIASSMSVVDASFDDSGTVAYRVYAVKNGVYSSASTTTRSFSMPSLDVSSMSVIPDTNSFHIQYELPDTRFLDHVEIYKDAETTSGALARSGAALIYTGRNPSYKYNIGSNDMEKYHQFWVEVVTV